MTFHTKDSPEANGRIPQKGDVQHEVWFILDTGERLNVFMGQPGWDAFKRVIREMAVDDQLEESIKTVCDGGEANLS